MNWLMLGRNGDIMQVLPAIKWEAEQNCEPHSVICSREFAPLLDGVSYCEALPYEGTWDDVAGALAWAEQQFPDDALINCSIYGKRWKFVRQESNYQRDIWRNTGCPYQFGTLPLVFDKRDYRRELDLIEAVGSGRFILTHFRSISSPFSHGEQVRATIEQARPDLRIVDLSDFPAYRIYDFLGLMERAQALVCCDSALLHLSRAVPSLPVLAFLTDGPKPWNRSEPHSGVIWHALYSQIAKGERYFSFKSALKRL